MDTFVEQIIVKKKGPKEIAIITGTILLVVILVFVLFLFLNYFSLVIDMLLIYGAWWLITGLNVRFLVQGRALEIGIQFAQLTEGEVVFLGDAP